MNPAYRPMLATLANEPFDSKEWVFETKWDGFRLITEKRGNNVRLWSRNGVDVTSRYTVLLPALQKIEDSCVIDGEICALDARGRSRFQLLQNALDKNAKLLYVVFDALWVDPILPKPYDIKDGSPHIPNVPGVGLERNEDAITANAARRQACYGSLLLGQANARVAEVQGRA